MSSRTKKRPRPGDATSPAQQAGAEIREFLKQGEDAFYDATSRYIDVRDKKEYLPDYKSAHDFANAEIPMAIDALKLWIGLVAHFAKSVVDLYDPTNLSLFIRWANAAHVTIPPDPGPVPVQFASGPDGTKPFSQCTAADLRDAIKLANGGTVPGGKIPANELKILNQAQGLFESSEGGEAPASMRWRSLNGRTKVTFADVDLYEIKAMMQIMESSFPDDGDAPSSGKKPKRRR